VPLDPLVGTTNANMFIIEAPFITVYKEYHPARRPAGK
jgi:hypothetical protein